MLTLGLAFWLLRPNGSDIYILFILSYTALSGINGPSFSIKEAKILIYISLALITFTSFIKLYSFGYHYLDLGYEHHINTNLLINGEYYNKIYDRN